MVMHHIVTRSKGTTQQSKEFKIKNERTRITMETMKVRITFTEELLGTANGDPAIHEEWIASKAPDAPSRAEEIASMGTDEAIEKSMTVFPRTEDKKPFLYDYQIRGFFKEAAGFINQTKPAKEKLAAHKKKVDGLIFVKPRKIVLNGVMNPTCQRPLRAQTAQGERVALANSEAMAAGTTAEFEIVCMADGLMKFVREWLDYGEWHGLGQWRNSGKGAYLWEELDDKGKVIGGNLKR